MSKDADAEQGDQRGISAPGLRPAPVMPAPVMPAPVMPAPVMPAPVMPAPVMPDTTATKPDLPPLLVQNLRELATDGVLALAYSGGLDSRFLAHTALLAGLKPLLLHATGPHVAAAETAFAREWAQRRALSLREIEVNPLALPTVASGDRSRCYACKKLLFSLMQEEAAGLVLCDGTHASDHYGYRPGLAALAELGIRSPLADAGLSKPDIRLLARSTGLEEPDQRARPCLLTRLPYDESPTAATLTLLADVEEAVFQALLRMVESQDKDYLRPESVPQNSVPQNSLSPESLLPDFRVRLTSPGRLELHIQPSTPPLPDLETLFPPLLRTMRETVTAHGLNCELNAVNMENLSGYFDRVQGITAGSA